MMNNKHLWRICCLILLTVITADGLFAQDIDTTQAISLIRKQYGIIINQQIENLQITDIDNSYEPTEEEMEEAPSVSVEQYSIYHNDADTFLIRRYNMNDEGGAFSHSVEEVFLWDNKPFFYYKKTYVSWSQTMEETRVYIANGKVIQKLSKESFIPWNELPADFYETQTDAPNRKCKITQGDLNEVMYFIESSKASFNK